MLDVLEVDGIRNAWAAIDVARESPQTGILHNSTQITFEVAVLHTVETDQRGEQPDISFG